MEWLYENNEDNSSRYLLGTKGKNTLFVFGINPSTAEPNALDPTLKSVQRIAEYNDYDSWIMLNVYPKRDTIFDNLSDVVNDEEHHKNIEIIKSIFSKQTTVNVWVAFGNHIYDREYLKYCLKDIYSSLLEYDINWLSIGVTNAGAPKHPLYQKSTSVLSSFNMEEYVDRLV